MKNNQGYIRNFKIFDRNAGKVVMSYCEQNVLDMELVEWTLWFQYTMAAIKCIDYFCRRIINCLLYWINQTKGNAQVSSPYCLCCLYNTLKTQRNLVYNNKILILEKLEPTKVEHLINYSQKPSYCLLVNCAFFVLRGQNWPGLVWLFIKHKV